MSEESIKARLRAAGITDFTPEGFLKRSIERGDQEGIAAAKKHIELEARLKRIHDAIRNGIDPKTIQ